MGGGTTEEGSGLGMAETKKQVVRSWETHHFCIGTSSYGIQ
jgi:hypothetical protein